MAFCFLRCSRRLRVIPATGGGMKQEMYLKKNSDFQEVYRSGKSRANKSLVMYVLSTGRERPSRIGIVVIARNEARNRNYTEIERDLLHLAAMHHILRGETP